MNTSYTRNCKRRGVDHIALDTRIKSLPKELRDQIFTWTLLAATQGLPNRGLPRRRPPRKWSGGYEWERDWKLKRQYDKIIIRYTFSLQPQDVLSDYVLRMITTNEAEDRSKIAARTFLARFQRLAALHEINLAAALGVSRRGQKIDDLLKAASYLRLRMVFTDAPYPDASVERKKDPRFEPNIDPRFKRGIEKSSHLCTLDMPSFLLATCKKIVFNSTWRQWWAHREIRENKSEIPNVLPRPRYRVESKPWYFFVDDGKVRALVVAYWDFRQGTHYGSAAWFSVQGAPWVFTASPATPGVSNDGVTGVALWKLDDGTEMAIVYEEDSIVSVYMQEVREGGPEVPRTREQIMEGKSWLGR